MLGVSFTIVYFMEVSVQVNTLKRQFWLQMIDSEKLYMDNNLGQVMRVLQYYEAQGLLQMIRWQWPLTNKQFRFSQTLNVEVHNISTHLTMTCQVLRTEFAAPRLFTPESTHKQIHNIHRLGREYCSRECGSI